MEEKLYNAAIEGKTENLQEILTEDAYILHKIATRNSVTTPLHVASSLGHIDFVKKLLDTCPDLVRVLDQRRRSALHLAAEKGHTEVVIDLLAKGKDMCRAVDKEGRNPLHMAAIKGNTAVLKTLMKEVGADVAQERVRNGQTILHLCVLYGQLETMKELMATKCKEPINAVNEWGNTILHCRELINAVDEWGNTILHLAVADKHLEMVDHLVKFKLEENCEKMNLNVKNADGHTALDILEHSRKETEKEKETYEKMEKTLGKRKARRAKDVTTTEWLTNKRESLMIVTVLIAAIAFQAGVSPPGGVWPDNTPEHTAGQAIIANTYSKYYPYFVRANTVGFVASSSTILLLLSDLPFHKKTLMWFLVLVMWLTITSMVFTYSFAITVTTPKSGEYKGSLTRTIFVAIVVWTCVMSLLLIAHSIRLIKSLVEENIETHKKFINARIAIRKRSIRVLSGMGWNPSKV